MDALRNEPQLRKLLHELIVPLSALEFVLLEILNSHADQETIDLTVIAYRQTIDAMEAIYRLQAPHLSILKPKENQ